MPELRLPPTPLERVVGQLVEAGLSEPAALARHLGLEPRQLARPLRHLAAVGVVERDARGLLRLTADGRAWLSIDAPSARESLLLPAAPPAPALKPVRLHPGEDPLDMSDPDDEESGWSLRLSRLRLPRLPIPRLPRPRLHIPRLEVPSVPWPAIQNAGLLRVGASAAAGLVLVGVSVGSGLPASVSAATASTFASLIEEHGPRVLRSATPTPWAAPTFAAAPPAASTPTALPRERWVRVVNTDNQGLVLRPEPASAVRVRNLPEGTRLRVTGEQVQKDARFWLPVQPPSGPPGWAAAEYLMAAEP